MVTDSEGVREVFKSLRPGVLHHRVHPRKPDGTENLFAHGIYTLQTVFFEDGAPDTDTRRTVSYGDAPLDLPLPTPGQIWNAEVVVWENGTVTTEQNRFAFEAETTISIGGCTFRMQPITATFSGAPNYIETLYYLPDLGLALYGAFKDGDESATFSYSKIETLK